MMFRLAETAERCYMLDSNTSLIKVRQLGEAIATKCSGTTCFFCTETKQIDLLKDLDYTLKFTESVKETFPPFESSTQ